MIVKHSITKKSEIKEILADPQTVASKETHSKSTSSKHKICIVVPTKNEAGNIDPLVKRIHEVMGSIPTQIIFVDDSADNTPEVVTQVAIASKLDVVLLHRPPERWNGLGKAVVEGLELAQGEYVVVMDGDLQHPPEIITTLLQKAESQKLDMVVASRLAKGGGTEGLSFYRKVISWVLAVFMRVVFPHNLRQISDPLTGFFLVRRERVDTTKLQPEGFKILLEILCRCPNLKVDEVAFKFGKRLAGESKANGTEMMRLLRQVTRLRGAAAIKHAQSSYARFTSNVNAMKTSMLSHPRWQAARQLVLKYRQSAAARRARFTSGVNAMKTSVVSHPRLQSTRQSVLKIRSGVEARRARFTSGVNAMKTSMLSHPRWQSTRRLALQYRRVAQFLTVGASGIFVNTFIMYVLTDFLGMYYLISAVFSTQGSTAWNFGWSEAWVFGDRPNPRGFWKRASGYFTLNNSMLLLRGPMLAVLVSQLGMNYLLANLLSLTLMAAARYTVSDKLIWKGASATAAVAEGKTYLYNIHDIITVRSMQRLPELGYFKTDQLAGEPDIDVILSWSPKKHCQPDSLTYGEMFGRFGFSMVINRGEKQTRVYASRLIGMSPHVLYTNVIESLLRWTLVRKGYALMHGACVSFNDQALFITAQTDTGKTTTILFTIKDNLEKIEFLSDDMTIFKRDGSVMCYPKPLTISQHTLQAVKAAPLAFKERLFLQVQSRIHSRDGRRFAMWLTQGNFPAATLNAVIQWIVPPPKYMVDRLVPNTAYGTNSQLAQIVLIERGDDMEKEIDDNVKTNILVANAEDAYGFPPYPAIAKELRTWNGQDLYESERAIVDEAIRDLPATLLRSSNYGWYKRLPTLLESQKVIDTSGLFAKVTAKSSNGNTVPTSKEFPAVD